MPGFGPVDLWDQKKLAYRSSESTLERHRKSALSNVIPLVPLRKRYRIVPLRKRRRIRLNQVHAIEVQYGTKLGTATLLTARTPSATADAHLEPNRSQKVRDPVPHRRPPRRSITIDCRSEYVAFQQPSHCFEDFQPRHIYHYTVLPAILLGTVGILDKHFRRRRFCPGFCYLQRFAITSPCINHIIVKVGVVTPLGLLVGWGKARA